MKFSYGSTARKNGKSRFEQLRMEELEGRRLLAGIPELVALSADTRIFEGLEQIPASRSEAVSYIAPTNAVPFTTDVTALRAALASAPMEFTVAASNSPLEISIPKPDGSYATFEVVEAPVMHPDLAARYPDIKTYRGWDIDNQADTIRFDVTPQGFHAQVLSANGAYYIDPYYHLDSSVYVSYARDDFALTPETQQLRESNGEIGVAENGVLVTDAGEFVIGAHAEGNITLSHVGELPDTDGVAVGHADHDAVGREAVTTAQTGDTLRTYRLANASTIEYTNFHGGTKAAGMAAIVTAVNRVTGVYEVELTIRMELVANNDDLVFTNSTGDPYSNNNGFAMLGQNQSEINSTIGSANYDIGHVFSTGGGGVAGLGVVGFNNSKAEGVTGLNAPVADPFYIDYVAHEMGHQFGGSHTFNGDSNSCSSQRSASSAYEPGSGSTIQAYAGICGNDNLQFRSDPYFHWRSLDQILSHTDTRIPNVGTRTATGNNGPKADAGPNYEIPAGTPFLLTGSGLDADGDSLTFNWEQSDLGPQADLRAADQGSIPLFRSRPATAEPTRFFPRISNLLSNNYTQGGEKLPTVARRMDFRMTVRDNVSGAGGVDSDAMWVDINDTGAPFSVTSQNSNNIVWRGGEAQTITWDVSGTDAGQINTPNVDIILSDDGGQTYTVPLATGVPNNGSYTFTVANVPEISQARLMVRGSGNIFFDINNRNFTIADIVTVGDFNGDGQFDCTDIDMLTTEISSGGNDLAFDVTDDGMLNYDDVVNWVETIKGTSLGDANLDFSVDGDDFALWSANKFTSGTAWCSGDFDADGVTSGQDFLIWNANRSFPIAAPVRLDSVAIPAGLDRSVATVEPISDRLVKIPQAAPQALRVVAQLTSVTVRQEERHSEDDTDSKDRWSDFIDGVFAADIG